MTCSWCEERFERFLDGDLTSLEHARLSAHVSSCDACRSLLEELRVVDALLLQPRAIEPAPNFTCKTMADIRAMPPPATTRSHVPAYLTCYMVAAWLLIGAACLLLPQTMRAFADAIAAIARGVTGALGSIVMTFAGISVAINVALVCALAISARLAVPWFVQRGRT